MDKVLAQKVQNELKEAMELIAKRNNLKPTKLNGSLTVDEVRFTLKFEDVTVTVDKDNNKERLKQYANDLKSFVDGTSALAKVYRLNPDTKVSYKAFVDYVNEHDINNIKLRFGNNRNNKLLGINDNNIKHSFMVKFSNGTIDSLSWDEMRAMIEWE
jgi:hypothetical protein